MNDMSPGISLPEGGGSSPLSSVPPPSTDFSTPCDQVITALAQAQLEITPPVRTKHVHVVSRRTGGTYDYDYAPLETILAAVVKPLARHNLVLSQPIGGQSVSIVLYHTSGQWMRTIVPLMPRGDGYPFQDFSGALTAARRVGIQALLSISAEDDDDGNANAGNDINDRHWNDEIEAGQTALHPLARQAGNARSDRDGCALLDLWPSRALEMARMRRQAPEQWSAIVDAFVAGLKPTLGPTVAAAWRGALLAETAEHHAAVRAKWDGEWAPVLEKFRAARPEGFASLMRHVNERRSEIEVDARHTAGETTSIRDAAIEAQKAAGDGFRHLIIDALGDPATDVFADPEAWAAAYSAIREKTPPEEQDALDSFNMDAISEASHMIGADIILREAFDTSVAGPPDADQVPEEGPPAPQEIVAVEFPYNRNGGVDIARYLDALGEVIATLAGPDDIARFEALNRPRYTAASLSSVVQIRVLKALAGRKRALGIPLPTED